MGRKNTRRFVTAIATSAPFLLSHPVFAAATTSVAGVSNIQSFIKSVTTIIVSLSGSVAVIFFCIGGFGYITSSGNPEHLDRAKKTLIYAALGLAIAIGSFILGTIVTALATNAFGS